MKKILCSSVLLALTSGAMAASITDVVATSGADGYQIIFKNAGVQPTAFNANPNSVVLDFPNTTASVAQREKQIHENGIYSVNVIPGEGKTRAVLNLAVPATYQVKTVGNDIVVVFPKTNQLPVKAAPATKTATAGATTIAAPTTFNVAGAPKATTATAAKSAPTLNPMFHKSGKKGGTLSFTLPSDDTLVTVKTEGSNVIATIPNFSVAKTEQKRMDVADYATPVRFVDILRKGNDTRIAVNMGRNAYEYVTYQNGRTYTIEIVKPDENAVTNRARELAGYDKKYSGAPLSLNFQDIEVRAVLQIIAEFTQTNIVVSDSVTGNITLRLDNVPWDQALDIIMRTKSLAMRKNGSVIYIAPEAELNKSEIDALADAKRKSELLPSHTEIIQVKYAKASDLAKIIEDSRRRGGGDTYHSQDAILSSKGSISVDARTNALLVSDIPEKLQAVRDLVAKLDEPVRQVLVDSRLVITNDQFSKDLGAKFGVTFSGTDSTKVSGSGTLAGATAAQGGVGGASLGDRLGVNLPAASTAQAGSYGLSILGSNVLVDLELQAMQSEGRSEIISSPRVVTQDGYKALVAAGQEIPYSTTSDNGTDTSFKDAKLSMEVTPRIAPNDRVTMEIHITKDSPDYANLVNGEPPINTNEINTKVEVESGETIVLGGIYEQSQTVNVNKVPLLGDLPLVGNAFKNTQKSFDKNELLIFITPRIVDNRLTNGDKFSNLRD